MFVEYCCLILYQGDMLPVEYPQLCANKILMMDISRSLSVGTLFGTKCMKLVGWHSESAECRKLVQAMATHIDSVAAMSFTVKIPILPFLVGIVHFVVDFYFDYCFCNWLCRPHCYCKPCLSNLLFAWHVKVKNQLLPCCIH